MSQLQESNTLGLAHGIGSPKRGYNSHQMLDVTHFDRDVIGMKAAIAVHQR